MNLDFNKVIFLPLNEVMSEEKLNECKMIAKVERNYIEFHNPTSHSKLLQSRTVERVYKGSVYSRLSQAEKNVIEANIMLPNDVRVAEVLNNSDININALNQYLNCIRYIKKIESIDGYILTEQDKKIIKTCDNVSNVLINIFRKYVGYINIDTIVNKINEMVSFKADLLNKGSENKITRKMIKIWKKNKL